MESNANKVYVKQKSEFSRAFQWDARTLGQGGSNEGDQLLAMGPLPTKLDDTDSCEEIYYGVSIPSDATVGESDST
jgi:hypothetical protein